MFWLHKEPVSGRNKIKVAVLMGGPSSEHEVSLKSASVVANYLDRNKYEVGQILVSKKGEWEVNPELLAENIDVAFIAMHGEYGEDGQIQRILEDLKIPYTGSDAKTSALGMNKFLSLRFLKDIGLNAPPSYLFHLNEWRNMPKLVLERVKKYLGFPFVAKPNNAGSSVGVSIVQGEAEMNYAFNDIFNVSREMIIQPFISGREMTCGVLDYGFRESSFALMPTEIIPKVSHFFDYEAKYSDGGSDEITPPNLPDAFIKKIQQTALTAHRAMNCRGFSRTDMILDKANNLHVLEINTIPGLTDQSLLPKAARVSGIEFPDMLDGLIVAALHSHPLKKEMISLVRG